MQSMDTADIVTAHPIVDAVRHPWRPLPMMRW